MTLQDVQQLIALGEGRHIEFKRRVPRGRRIAKEVIALANTGGGHVLLGVGDDGTLAGVRDATEEEFALRRALAAHCRPPVGYTTERIPVGDRRDVILVHVPESEQKPHFLIDAAEAGDGTAYVRAGEMSVEASAEKVHLMEDDAGGAGVTFEFGDHEMLLMRYLDDYARVTVEEFAQMAGLARAEASQRLLNLTKANILQLQPGRRDDYFTLAPPSE